MSATILVIEDQLEVQRVVRRVLERAGYTVVSTNNGTEGLQLAQEHQPALILLDLTLPGLTGEQTAQQMRELPAFKHTPILAMSGRVEQHSVIAPFDGVIPKPFDIVTLTETVQRFLSRDPEA